MEAFTLEDVLHTASLVQSEAFSEASGLLYYQVMQLKGYVLLSIPGGGGKRNNKKKENKKDPTPLDCFTMVPHSHIFFVGEKKKNKHKTRTTTSVR